MPGHAFAGFFTQPVHELSHGELADFFETGRPLEGNVVAARELLTRCVGEPVPYDVLARLEELEKMVEEAKAWA